MLLSNKGFGSRSKITQGFVSRAVAPYLFIVFVVLVACRDASFPGGTYALNFEWADGSLRSADLQRLNMTSLSKQERTEVLDVAKGFIKEKLDSANLPGATGFTRFTVEGPAPHFLRIERFEISQPAFDRLLGDVNRQDVSEIKRMVEQFHNVNQRDLASHSTALHFAAAGARLEAIDALLSLGADPNARDYKGTTPLMFAVMAGNKQCVEALIRAGAKVNVSDNVGRSPISLASQFGRKEIETYLVSVGK